MQPDHKLTVPSFRIQSLASLTQLDDVGSLFDMIDEGEMRGENE